MGQLTQKKFGYIGSSHMSHLPIFRFLAAIEAEITFLLLINTPYFTLSIIVQISHILLCRPENGKFFREIILGVKYTTGRSPGSIETIKKYIPSRLPYGLDLQYPTRSIPFHQNRTIFWPNFCHESQNNKVTKKIFVSKFLVDPKNKMVQTSNIMVCAFKSWILIVRLYVYF